MDNDWLNDSWGFLTTLIIFGDLHLIKDNKNQEIIMRELKEELVKSKLALIDKVNEKLADKDITAEELKDLSTALSTLIGISDYMDKLYTGGFGFNGGCTTPSETK